jgi:hypothetical protein
MPKPDEQDVANLSPVSGSKEFPRQQRELMAARASMPTPARAMAGLEPGGLYGTDGSNLYLINKTTGVANLIGPHGPVEFAIGAIAFDTSGQLYGISLTENAQLYKIDTNTGAATAIGPLGIGFIFEGGLTFDSGGRLIGVDQGSDVDAKTFEINTSTGAATIISVAGEARDINDLTAEGSVIYGIDRVSNTLGRLDAVSGSYSPIGPTGATVGDAGGLALDPADGKLYATFAADGGFYTLDKSTGAATLIAINKVDYGLAFAPAPEPGKRFSYSVKFVCGVQERQEQRCSVVRPGVYATEINIHNYHDRKVKLEKFVLPVVHKGEPRGREPDFVAIQAKDSIVLPPNTATMDDCCRIAELLYGAPVHPLPLTIGYLEIVSSEDLAVDAVYTVTGLEGGGVSIDVERVEAKIKD